MKSKDEQYTLSHQYRQLSYRIVFFRYIFRCNLPTYDTEQEIYFQSKIDEIKMAVSNKKSAMAWKTVNDVSGRKNSNKAKITSISGEERIIVCHNYLKDLFGNPPK